MARLIVSVLIVAHAQGCVLFDPFDPYFKPPPQHEVGENNQPPQPPAPPVASPASRPADGPNTLAEAVAFALENNPGLSAACHGIDAAVAQRDISLGRALPEITVEGGYSWYRDNRLIKPRRPGPRESLQFTDDLIVADIVLTMPLYAGGRIRNRIRADELMARAARQQLFHSKTELVFNVSSVFYSMLGQREVINAVVFSKKALEEHHNRAKQLFHTQKAARVDLLRTEVRLADIEQRLIRERNVLTVKRSLFASLLGVSAKRDIPRIEGTLAGVAIPAGLDQGLATAYANRQDYQSLCSRINAQQRRLDIAQAGRLPEVSLRASYGNRWAADSSEDNEVGEIGVFVELPVFEGGRIAARIRKERSRLRDLSQRLRTLKLRIRLEVETATSNIESTRTRIDVTQKAVAQAKESLRIEREKYDVGKGVIVDVLDAQAALLDSQTNYYRALAEFNTAIAQFRLAVEKNHHGNQG